MVRCPIRGVAHLEPTLAIHHLVPTTPSGVGRLRVHTRTVMAFTMLPARRLTAKAAKLRTALRPLDLDPMGPFHLTCRQTARLLLRADLFPTRRHYRPPLIIPRG